MAKKYPLVEIIILHHSGLDIIKNCLNSLRKNKYSNLRITVVDQKSEDGSREMIKNKYKEVNLFVNNENDSFAKANNKILKRSKAKYCILLNDDTEHDPNWILKLVECAEKDKNAGALQPKVLSLKNKRMFEYAGAAGGFIDKYGYPFCRGRIFGKVEKDNGQYNYPSEIFWSCGVAMLINMDVIRKIGYLDEDIGSYGEELDLCWRMHLAGYKILYSHESRIYHLGSGTWGQNKLKLKKEYMIHRNHWILLFKNYSKSSWLGVIPMKFILESATFCAFLLSTPRKSLAILTTYGWILSHIGMLLRKNKDVEKLRKVDDSEIKNKMLPFSIGLRYFLGDKNKIFRDYENKLNYAPFKKI